MLCHLNLSQEIQKALHIPLVGDPHQFEPINPKSPSHSPCGRPPEYGRYIKHTEDTLSYTTYTIWVNLNIIKKKEKDHAAFIRKHSSRYKHLKNVYFRGIDNKTCSQQETRFPTLVVEYELVKILMNNPKASSSS
jgi:hypothetical protein